MSRVKVNMSVASMIPSSEIPDPGVIRAPRGTNPVNSSPEPTREMVPLSQSAIPRVQHPAINTLPWSTSYAQSRSEPVTSRPNTMKNRYRRKANEKRGRL